MSEQLQQLQAELDSVKSKLAKTEASKQKLKESWALLKEKVINAHALCDERDALLEQLDEASSERATAQQRLQEALQQKADVAKQYGAAEAEKQRLDKQLTAATAEKQHLEKRLADALTAAKQAQHQYRAALKQQSAAGTAMQAMQRQLNKLQCTVEQLQQQQISHRLSILEQHWKHLTDREHVVTVDQSEMKKAVRPALHELLQQQLEPRLSAAEQVLQLMQRQQHKLAPAARGRQQQQQQQQQQHLAPQEDLHKMQQLLEVVAAEQQELREELATIQQQLAAQQHVEVAAQRNLGRQVNSGTHDTAAITALASLQRLTVSLTALPAADADHSVGCEHAAQHSHEPAIAAAVKCNGAGSDMQSIRGSSMFGTTLLNIGGSSSNHNNVDRAGSPSEASVQQRFAGHKRPRQEQRQQNQQMHAPVQSESAADSSRQTCAGARLFEDKSTQQHQLHQHFARPSSSSVLSSSSDGSESDDASEQSPKRQMLQQQHQQSVRVQQKAQHRAQQQQEAQQSASPIIAKQRQDKQQPDGPRPVPEGQHRLAIHFQALGHQQSDAETMARQVAKLVTSGQLHIQDVVAAACDSVLSAAADHYDVTHLQQAVSAATQQQDSQPDLELLGTVGWASQQHGPAKVIIYHQRLAGYVKELSDLLLRQQQQAGIVGCSSTAGEVQQLSQPLVAWPAAADCWQQLLSDLDGLHDATSLSQQTVFPTTLDVSSADTHAAAVNSSLLHQVVQRLMQPVQRACGAAAAAKAPLTLQQAQHQAQHLQQLPLAQACAATAVAVRLLRLSNDRQGFHCIVVKVVLAAAQASGWSSSSHSSTCASSTGGLQCRLTEQAGIVYCLACLLAAIGAWRQGLQLDDDLDMYPGCGSLTAAAAAAGIGDGVSHSSRTREEQTWQLLVIDPVLVALSSCLGTLAHKAAAAAAKAKATPQLGADSSSPLSSLGQALLAMHTWGAAVAAGGQACADLDATMRDKDQRQASVADHPSQALSCVSRSGVDGISAQLEPTDLLASLLGVLKLLLQKQHSAVSGSRLVASEAAWSTCAAGYCLSVRLLAAVAAPEKLAALLREFQSVLSSADGHAPAECSHARQLLGPLLLQLL